MEALARRRSEYEVAGDRFCLSGPAASGSAAESADQARPARLNISRSLRHPSRKGAAVSFLTESRWILTVMKKYRLARMSDGHYCLVRDLGPLKGGKGMKHHDVIVDFTLRGIVKFSTRPFVKPKRDGIVHRPHESKLFHLLRSWLGVRKPPG